MTEDEAKTKRCPVGAGQFVTVQGPDGPVAGARVFGANCVGSACMAWRWTHGGPSTPPDSGDPGFCGLAGR